MNLTADRNSLQFHIKVNKSEKYRTYKAHNRKNPQQDWSHSLTFETCTKPSAVVYAICMMCLTTPGTQAQDLGPKQPASCPTANQFRSVTVSGKRSFFPQFSSEGKSLYPFTMQNYEISCVQ